MYESYWQLERRPFQDAADGEMYFPAEPHEAAILKMRYVVENALGAGLVIGDPGTGKSHLTRMLEDRLPENAGPIVRLQFPQMTPAEILNHLAAELAVHAALDPGTGEIGGARTATDGILRRVFRLLDVLASDGRHALIVVDEGHLFDDERPLHTLHLLLNHQPRGRLEFSMLLMGTSSLLPRIERIPQLHDRLAVKSLLRRLDAEETAGYVRHRLEAAGRGEGPFDAAALRSLFACSQGVPRRINRLADMALLVGYADRLATITADVVEGVAEELVAVRAA